ncbi:predicted protein [Aspergillus terreus NIH2624]|uniref:Uncharacterized protein n=1 Tax=Aspergillus terreus (strain NIH 2624 / FGSC A1156) TaxID=341663 RepID=Q0C828_ASPTN|nr:uncharacterized protein ATEG_10156 [Aspergillus terreus NIH2624]EAU29605.1 predicted protein [Aspergillus terreus NIH2624]
MFAELSQADRDWQDQNRASRRRLANLREETWGWVVYRTTYKSDAMFQRAIDIISSWIKWAVYRDLYNTPGVPNPDPTSNNQLWARHSLTIIEDSTVLDGVSLDVVRSHFESWVEQRNKRDRWNKYRVCMAIDEEILELLVHNVLLADPQSKMSGENKAKDMKEWHVKVVEAFPDYEEGAEGYEGWMNCSVYALVYLWDMMDDATYMGHWYCRLEDGVFCG